MFSCIQCQDRGWLALEDPLLKLGYLGEIMPCPDCQPDMAQKWLSWRREVPALLPDSLRMDGEYPPGMWDLDDIALALEEAIDARFRGKRLTGSMLAGFLAWRIKQSFQVERHNQRLKALLPQRDKGIKEAKRQEEPLKRSQGRTVAIPKIPSP